MRTDRHALRPCARGWRNSGGRPITGHGSVRHGQTLQSIHTDGSRRCLTWTSLSPTAVPLWLRMQRTNPFARLSLAQFLTVGRSQRVRRAATLRNTENLPLGRSHYSQCRVGTADDNLAPRPPNVGRYRHIHGPRGQYLLAAAPGWQG